MMIYCTMLTVSLIVNAAFVLKPGHTINISHTRAPSLMHYRIRTGGLLHVCKFLLEVI